MDQRGRSSPDKHNDGYALADLAVDVRGLIEKRPLNCYMMIGHSIEGKVAQLLPPKRSSGLGWLGLFWSQRNLCDHYASQSESGIRSQLRDGCCRDSWESIIVEIL